jgi:hypothetical protein
VAIEWYSMSRVWRRQSPGGGEALLAGRGDDPPDDQSSRPHRADGDLKGAGKHLMISTAELSGALYRHFESKEALLGAGIDRQLDRRRAMHDIRALFAGLDDLHAELTVLGRYLLTVIDQELELLQIATRTPAGLSDRLDTAYAALVDGLTAELAGWIAAWGPTLTKQH